MPVNYMSVNAGQRNVPDTSANRQLQACEKAMELAIHTIKICSNKKIFVVGYQTAITDDVIRCAKNIYTNAWKANNIYVTKDNGRWRERERLQLLAISECQEMLALINICRRLFHLRGGKVKYWSQLTIETRQMIHKWYEANAKQYRV